MSASLLRVAARGTGPVASTFFRSNTTSSLRYSACQAPLTARAAIVLPSLVAVPSTSFSSSAVQRSEHQEETFEEFSARYELPKPLKPSYDVGNRPRAGKQDWRRQLGAEEG